MSAMAPVRPVGRPPVRIPQPLRWPLPVVWVLLAITAASIWIVGIPLYHHQAETLTNVNGFITRHPAEWRDGLRQLGLSPSFYAALSVASESVIAWPAFVIGVIIFIRKSDEFIGLYIATVLILFGTTGTNSVAIAVEHAYPSVAHAVDLLDNYGFLSFFLIPLIFPDGRFVPRWNALIVGVFVLSVVIAGLFPRSPLDTVTWPEALDNLLALLVLASLVTAPVYRYIKVSDARQRQQIKWVVVGLFTSISIFAAASIAGSSTWFTESPVRGVLFDMVASTTVALAFLLVPISFAIAMFRYRLWGIDVLINRTLVYGLLTVTLVATYILGVIAVQAVLRSITGQGSELAVAIVTLAIAALFNPWRTRLQRFIDRRFYRRKYDAARVLARFQSRLVDEVDLDRLSSDLIAVVAESVQPERAALWLAGRNTEI